MKRILSCLLICVIISTLLAGCDLRSDEQKIQDRLDDFLSAYNSGDFEKVLDCFDARTRNTYKAAFNIGGSLLGGITGLDIGFAVLFGLGVGLMSDGDILRLDNVQIEFVSDSRALVTATLHYQDYETSSSQDMQFNLIKEDNEWFITE